jgi:hypothetical protein
MIGIHPKAQERNGPGHQPCDNGNQRFDAIPGDREIFEVSAPTHQALAVECSGVSHSLLRIAPLLPFAIKS